MKTLGILLLIFPLFCFSQNNGKNARAIYQFTHIRDTTQPDKPYIEQMALEFSDVGSRYKSYSLYQLDSVANKIESIPGGKMKVPKATYEELVYYYSPNELYWVRPWLGGDSLIIKESMSTINWNLTDQKKEIAGFKCFLAKGYFNGRLYYAWFSPDVPIKAGPWKLNGLPGLILEAVDSTGSVRFEMVRLQNIQTVNIDLPKRGRTITHKEWEQIKEGLRQNPAAYLGAGSIGGDPNQKTSIQLNKTSSGPPSKSTNRINNPLELSN